MNSTELRLDTPASISSHKLDSIIRCKACIDGEKSLVNIAPGARQLLVTSAWMYWRISSRQRLGEGAACK